MSPLAQRLRRFWFELWNDRAMDAMLQEMHPDWSQVDHRSFSDSGVTLSDWEALMRSWWELAPDLAAVEFEPLGESGSHLLYYVLFSGHDTVSGGQIEAPTYIVVGVRDDLLATGEIFDDRHAALARFAACTGTT